MLLLVSSRTATWMSGFAGATDAAADPAIANAMRSAMKERLRRMRPSLVILLLDVRRGESATGTSDLLRGFYAVLRRLSGLRSGGRLESLPYTGSRQQSGWRCDNIAVPCPTALARTAPS